MVLPGGASALVVPAGGHAVLVAKLAQNKTNAEVWTASLAVDSPAALGYGGRADVNERFVILAWPHSTDCPLPGGNDAHASQLQAIGLNSIFYKGGGIQKNCGVDPTALVNGLAAKHR